MKAAKNYIKRFEQKIAVEFNCLYKLEGGRSEGQLLECLVNLLEIASSFFEL